MASRDNYMQVATQIANNMNAFRQAFKTYNISDFDAMIKAIAGEGSRVSTDDTSEHLKNALLERGFTIFPAIKDAKDGYVRVIRSNSIVGSLLNAFKYVGSNGDAELANLLNQIKRRPQADTFGDANAVE